MKLFFVTYEFISLEQKKSMNDFLQVPFEYFYITAENPLLKDLNVEIPVKNILGVALCTQGHIEISIDGHRYSISERDMYFFTPSLFVQVLSVDKDFNCMFIQTSFEFILSIINKMLDVTNQLAIRSNPCISLNKKQYEDVKSMIFSLDQRIHIEKESFVNPVQKNILRELILSLGTTLCCEIVNIFFTNRPFQSLPQDRNDMLFQNFIILLYHNYLEHREVNFYADKLCMTPNYLSSVIKSKSGKSALQWIVEIVITDAKQKLRYSKSSIKEIAAYFNFPTQSFFGKYFKQYVGTSPKDYRKQFMEVKDE